MANLLSRSARILGAPVALILLGLVASLRPFWLYLATAGAVAYILTTSFNIIYGYAGIFSLAHVSIYGIGAYVAVLLQMRLGVPFIFATLVAVVASAGVGALIAWPTLRLREMFLAIATLGFAVTIEEVFLRWTPVTGGGQGILGIPLAEVFGVSLMPGSVGYFALCALGALIAWEVSFRIAASETGRQFVVLRTAPRALVSVGLSPARVRLSAFVTASALAGLSGVLFAHLILFISSESFSLGRLIELILATLIGGTGALLGPVFGVVVLLGISEAGATLREYSELIFGLAIIVFLGYGRGGVAQLLEALYRRFRPRDQSWAGLSGLEPPAIQRNSDDVVRVKDVSVGFGGVQALTGVNLEFRQGRVLGLIGPNGAGKTTLVNVITGLTAPSSGTVVDCDDVIVGLEPEKIAERGIIRTFQTPQLVPEFDVLTNVMIGHSRHSDANALQRLLDLPKSKAADARARRIAMHYLELLGVADAAGSEISAQPYGVQRLVEVARAVIGQPRFILLDEPGAGLTAPERDDLSQAIRRFADSGIGFIVIDHNVAFVTEVSDELAVLDQGKVLAVGVPSEVVDRDDVQSAYLGGIAVDS